MRPTRPGSVIGSNVFGSSTAAVMPGKGLPIEPGLIGIPGKFEMTMQPVSVCQNVSWNGRPNASRDQWTASGLSGSPTLARCRSEERS